MLREALLNAIVHRDYGTDSDITISLFADRVTIWNFRPLLAPLNAEMLTTEHPSRRRNPLVAGCFFRLGYIEAWGRGTLTMIETLKMTGSSVPLFREYAGGFEITIYQPKNAVVEKPVGPSRGPGRGPSQHKEKILAFLAVSSLSKAEIARKLGLNAATGSLKRTLRELLASGQIAYTLPDRPLSRLQKYRRVVSKTGD